MQIHSYLPAFYRRKISTWFICSPYDLSIDAHFVLDKYGDFIKIWKMQISKTYEITLN